MGLYGNLGRNLFELSAGKCAGYRDRYGKCASMNSFEFTVTASLTNVGLNKRIFFVLTSESL